MYTSLNCLFLCRGSTGNNLSTSQVRCKVCVQSTLPRPHFVGFHWVCCCWRFYDLRANASLQPEGKKPNLDAKSVSARRKEANIPASTSANANSQFVSSIRAYSISRPYFHLPLAFARSNGLMGRCEMILRDEKRRSWSVQIGPVGPQFAITRGWRQFREANGVQLGDTYKFELIDNGMLPIAYFHYLRANASLQREGKKPNLDAKRVSARRKEANASASIFANAKRQFISTIKPYSISRNILYLPSAFAKLNGLVNRRCEMILRDEKHKSWSVQLVPMVHHITITRGWRQFREANDVQVGDTYKFELIDNGKSPIAYFHNLRANASLQLEGKKPNLDAKRVSARRKEANASALIIANANRQFISTIKPYYISRNVLYLPSPFAKSNGVMNR
ncbi:B3 domain-containing protein REM10-like isoform X4 [Lycium barbarum]|uniref:B3 domain-containing protein REM10-like isoform X4 n=1 Tax=Lycium barbarum TaxID=112863 RepID=UPI00293E35B0|nr:B3 domain-containing protein REM10-like isoform X4 [Lycium barbarum]